MKKLAAIIVLVLLPTMLLVGCNSDSGGGKPESELPYPTLSVLADNGYIRLYYFHDEERKVGVWVSINAIGPEKRPSIFVLPDGDYINW